MSWSVVLDHGGDISHLLDTASITRTVRLHTEMKANVNKLDFRVKYDATLFGILLSYDTIEVTVLDDAVPYFQGYLSPNYKAVIRDGQRYINMTAEDPTLQLLGQIIADPWAKAGYAVCTPAATATSLVHAICTEAGVTLAAGAPTISTTIPYVVALPEDKLTWAKLLEQLLFEYGYVYTFDASGDLVLYPTINPSTVTATGTLTTASGTANIRGEIEIEKSPEKYDDIRINYDLVELKTGITVFKDQDTIDIAATGDPDGKDYYPLTSKVGEVFSKWNSPDGYDIWVVTSPVLSATLGAGVSLVTALTNYYRKASFCYRNTSGAASTITGLSMTGNAYVIASKNTARSSLASAKNLYEYQAKYIYTDAAAETLAELVGQYYKYSDIKYRIRSTTVLTLGQYVNVVDAVYAGLSTKCRVVGITQHEAPTVVYEYALEGVADFVAITIVTEGGHDGIPTPADFGTSDYYSNTPPTNNVDDLVFASAQNPNGNIDITVEWTYEQGAVPADGFLVYYKRAITTPGTINLNEDPSAFVQAQSTAGVVDYSTTLTLPTRQSGAGSIPIHYRFGVVAFGTRRSGTVPHAGGVVEDSGWLDEVFAADMTDMVIRSYKGQGVQRRAIQIDAESIDFIDTPDTSPATDEQLRFRLGRLGVGGAVLADGELMANCEFTWGAQSIINSDALSTYSCYHQQPDGTLRYMYVDSNGLCERTQAFGSATWSASTVVDSASGNQFPSYLEDSDGTLYIYYLKNVTGANHVAYRVLSGTWGASSILVAADSAYLVTIARGNGNQHIAYKRVSDNYAVERIDSGSGFGSEEIITTTNAAQFSYVEDDEGILYFAYRRLSDDYLYETADDGTGWGAASAINSAASSYPTYVKLINGTLTIFYTRNSDNYIVWRIKSSTGWGAAVVANGAVSGLATGIQLYDGSIRLAYQENVNSYLAERTLQRYARVGAGIIESGSNANGSYIKFSDGTMQQWGEVSTTPASGTTHNFTVTYPTAFIAASQCFPAVHSRYPGGGGGATNIIMSVYALSPGTTTSTCRLVSSTSESANTYFDVMWHAIGRWK
jgi:hypothetical protein